MSNTLTEEEMRRALFGASDPATAIVPPPVVSPPAPKRASSRPTSPKLRVTLYVTQKFEGEGETFTYDANTLSTLVAEQEAKKAAKNKKFRYCEVVSIHPI
ncbi:hypothetical protein POF45_01875 [Pseudomonas sp. 681]|uniref:Uncharacterized protein n=1 Tax=Pseudomonas fungipugnans TaxID=3024217 RepID=A0ABT6QH21_9PSED|nr:hypothetical protein [Pseudomonas sp. 681]MDI2590179.1 hypothetical protein [Pseudomonas sp. 681]